MKILIITHKPSFPKSDGGCLASAQIILGLELLGLDYKIATICTPKHPFLKEAYPKEIREKIALNFHLNTGNISRNLIAWFASEKSMFLARFYEPKFEKQLQEICNNYQPDIIHFESLFAAVYLPALRAVCDAKMLLRSHNIEHELWQDRLKKSNSLKKWFLKNHVLRLKTAEMKLFRSADGIATISKNEFNFLSENQITTPAIYLPTGMTIGTENSSYGNDFFHLAAMDWQPNINGLNWLIHEVWSKSDFQQNRILHIAGKSLNQKDFSAHNGVKNHGMVKDSRSFMCDFGIMLIPLFEGSGLRIKIIEAGGLGVPIIATSKAVEGIGLKHGIHFLEANTASEFQKAMQLLMNDVSLRRSLGEAIRHFIKENFNQDVLNS